MRSPATHEVEDGAAPRKTAQIDFANGPDGGLVYMHDEARREVERLVVGVVEAAQEIRFELGWHGGIMPVGREYDKHSDHRWSRKTMQGNRAQRTCAAVPCDDRLTEVFKPGSRERVTSSW